VSNADRLLTPVVPDFCDSFCCETDLALDVNCCDERDVGEKVAFEAKAVLTAGVRPPLPPPLPRPLDETVGVIGFAETVKLLSPTELSVCKRIV
jgi:hypothetical protein